MTPEAIEFFNDSYERCSAIKEFIPRFYEVFLASSPEVAEKFKNTDFKRQVRTLKSSIYLMLVAIQGRPDGLAHLEEMAEIHAKTRLDIAPHLYDIWLDSLLKTVSECDPLYSEDVRRAWIAVLSPGIEYMKGRYMGAPGSFTAP